MLREHADKKDDRWSVGSRNKLKASMRYKIRRVFAACLDIIEHELELSKKDKGAFEKVRKKILGIGNDQIRNMEAELERYNISYIPYHIDMEVISLDELKELLKGEGNEGKNIQE
jgi:hypothetical protein